MKCDHENSDFFAEQSHRAEKNKSKGKSIRSGRVEQLFTVQFNNSQTSTFEKRETKKSKVTTKNETKIATPPQ